MKPCYLVTFVLAFIVAAFTPPNTYAQATPPTKTLFISEDGRFSVELPADWYGIYSSPSLQVANQAPRISQVEFEVDTPGDMGFQILPIAKADLVHFDLAADASMVEVADGVITHLMPARSSDFSAVEALENGDARFTYRFEEYDGAIYLIDHLAPATISLLMLAAYKNEFTPTAENDLLRIYHSVQYSLELTETYASPDGLLRFDFPATWVTQDDGSGLASLYDSQATADAPAEIFEDAQVQMTIRPFDRRNEAEQITETALLTEATQLAGRLTTNAEYHPVMTEAVIIKSPRLTHLVILVEISSDIAKSGVVMIFDETTQFGSIVVYSAGLEIGDRLFLTALTIGQSALPTS